MLKNKTYSTKTPFFIEAIYDNSLLLKFLLNNLSKNLHTLENYFKVSIYIKGSKFKLESKDAIISNAKQQKNINNLINVLNKLSTILIDSSLLENDYLSHLLVKENKNLEINQEATIINTKRKTIAVKNLNQQKYCNYIDSNIVTFGLGVAGTGKTYLAVAKAVEYFLLGKIDKIIISRPIVEAGESLGYLPGGMEDKVDPYLKPIKDALLDMLPNNFVEDMIKYKQLEIAPIAYMRGRTFSNSFVILDEAQNTTLSQLQMLLTRVGENSKLVITGDLTQIDLVKNNVSGLKEVVDILKSIKNISFISFSSKDVVRSKIVKDIVEAFNKYNKK
jgi:phosphate starvation-inducible PhoH-like protein